MRTAGGGVGVGGVVGVGIAVGGSAGVAVAAGVAEGNIFPERGILQPVASMAARNNIKKRLSIGWLILEHLDCVNTYTNISRHVKLHLPET
jgi:hypothetical protein